MAANGRNRQLEPAYKQHAVVDDECRVVLDVYVTTGEINKGLRGQAGAASGRIGRKDSMS